MYLDRELEIRLTPPVEATPHHASVALEPWRQILLDAADYIDAHGWCQNTLREGERVCALGAMYAVCGGYPPTWRHSLGRRRFLRRPLPTDAMPYAVAEMNRFLGTLVSWWNNRPDRTQDQVTAALRACAIG